MSIRCRQGILISMTRVSTTPSSVRVLMMCREKSWSREGEFQMADTDNSILFVDQMVERYWDILPMRELILDNGSQFGAHRRGDNKEWDSRFKRHVESFGIKLIPTSFKHPQINRWEDREVLRLLQQVQREVILSA